MYAYCENNPVNNSDPNGEWLNIVIGAVVGGLVSGLITYAQTGDIKQAAISGAAGAISGAIAATGIGILGQAGLTAMAGAAGDIATQMICEGKTLQKVDYKKAVKSAAVAGGCSLVGSGLGKITSYGYESAGKELLSKGQDKLLIGYLSKDSGASYSQFIRQGNKLVAKGKELINIARGISSVTGSILTIGIANDILT